MPQPIAVVPLEGRDALPFVDLHGEALFLHAVRSLLDVEDIGGRVVVTVEPGQRSAALAALDRTDLPAMVQEAGSWGVGVVRGPVTVLVHDPLCPLVPVPFLSRCLEEGPALVAYRPVTDTIKTVVDDHIADTLDRDRFGIVASPVLLAHEPDGGSSRFPPTTDFAALAAWLRERGPVRMRKAPSLGRRVDDPSAVNLLECMDEMARSVQER